MHRIIRLLILTLSFTSFASAEQPLTEYGPLEGRYEVIGRKPDSEETYRGTMRLIANKEGLRVERQIGALNVVGSAKFEFKTPDKIQVLTITYEEDQAPVESSCRIAWDLDNYARITCVYGTPGVGKNNSSGVEALFIQQLKSD